MKEEKRVHLTTCPKCKQRLRLEIKTKSFGGKISIKCPKCKQRHETVIPLPKGKSVDFDPKTFVRKHVSPLVNAFKVAVDEFVKK